MRVQVQIDWMMMTYHHCGLWALGLQPAGLGLGSGMVRLWVGGTQAVGAGVGAGVHSKMSLSWQWEG